MSRQTGATTLARKGGDKWIVMCLNHGARTETTARGPAWKDASHPANFCSKCKVIAAGKAEKITEGRLNIPAPTTKGSSAKKPAAKAPAKKATPRKPADPAKPAPRKPTTKKAS